MPSTTLLSTFAALSFGLTSFAAPLVPRCHDNDGETNTGTENGLTNGLSIDTTVTIPSIVANVQANLDSVLPEIQAIVGTDGDVNAPGLVLLLNSLTDSFTGARNQLDGLMGLDLSVILGGLPDGDVNSSIGSLLNGLAVSLEPLQGAFTSTDELSAAFDNLLESSDGLTASLEALLGGPILDSDGNTIGSLSNLLGRLRLLRIGGLRIGGLLSGGDDETSSSGSGSASVTQSASAASPTESSCPLDESVNSSVDESESVDESADEPL